MSDRRRRYLAAVALAQEILAERPGQDDFLLAQAFDDIRDEVAAGRKNQADFPQHVAHALELIESSMHSVKVCERPTLRVVR